MFPSGFHNKGDSYNTTAKQKIEGWLPSRHLIVMIKR